MYHDDSQRGMHNSINRKPKYNDRSQSFNSGTGYGYGNTGNYNGQQKRRPERFKQNSNGNDKLIKQNDLIIKLLKEIRDRLPAPVQQEGDQLSEALGERDETTQPVDQEKCNSCDQSDEQDAESVEEEEQEENFNS